MYCPKQVWIMFLKSFHFIVVNFLALPVLGNVCTGPGNGTFARNSINELICAMQCTGNTTCYSYRYQDYNEFMNSMSTTPSNCLLQTAFENNFLAEEVLSSTVMGSAKVCIHYPGDVDMHKYVPQPVVNVSAAAGSAGFNTRIEFPEMGVAKFYKIIEEADKDEWYAERRCGQEGGILPIVYTISMAKALDAVLNNASPFQYTGLTLDKETLTGTDKFEAVWHNGNVDWKRTYYDDGLICPKYEESLTFSDRAQIVFDVAKEAFKSDLDQPLSPKPNSFACEYVGSKNLALTGTAFTSGTHATFTADEVIDNNWALTDEYEDAGYWKGTTKQSWWAIDLGTIIALRMVVINPRLDGYGRFLKHVKVLVGNHRPDTSSDILDQDKYALCGQHRYTIHTLSGDLFGITCEECMMVGKFIILQNIDTWNGKPNFHQIAIFGMPLSDIDFESSV